MPAGSGAAQMAGRTLPSMAGGVPGSCSIGQGAGTAAPPASGLCRPRSSMSTPGAKLCTQGGEGGEGGERALGPAAGQGAAQAREVRRWRCMRLHRRRLAVPPQQPKLCLRHDRGGAGRPGGQAAQGRSTVLSPGGVGCGGGCGCGGWMGGGRLGAATAQAQRRALLPCTRPRWVGSLCTCSSQGRRGLESWGQAGAARAAVRSMGLRLLSGRPQRRGCVCKHPRTNAGLIHMGEHKACCGPTRLQRLPSRQLASSAGLGCGPPSPATCALVSAAPSAPTMPGVQ